MAKPTTKRSEPKADDPNKLLYPLTEGNGPPIKRGELLDLAQVMNDEHADQDARSQAAVRLAPFFHELLPEQTVPWPDYAQEPHARSQ